MARDPDGPNRCTSAYFTYQIYSLHVPCRALVRIPPVKLFSSSRTLAEEIRDPSATSEGRSVAVDRIDSTSTHTVVRPGGREAEEVRGRTYVRGRSEEGCPRSSRLRALALNLRSAVDLSWCSSCGSGLTATKLVCSGACWHPVVSVPAACDAMTSFEPTRRQDASRWDVDARGVRP